MRTPLKRIREEMNAKGFDALLVTSEINQRYTSGFHFTDGLVLVTKSDAHLLTDFRYEEAAENSVGKEFTVTTTRERSAYLKDAVSALGVKTIGFEGNSLSYAGYNRFKEIFESCELVNAGGLLEEIRQIKTPDELEKIAKAQNIADRAFAHVVKNLRTDMTELEVAYELEYAMRREGAEGFSFDTIAVSGDASALPHGVPRNEKLHKGFLTMDFGAKFDGYCSDMTRTVVIGKATPEIKKLYNTVLSAQLAALEYLSEGKDAGEADKKARDVIDAVPEYVGAFGHALGHSVGLEVHEAPTLSPRSFGRALRVGEILTVEPGIYLAGKYGCRIEDMVEIREDGVRNFASSPKELIEIC